MMKKYLCLVVCFIAFFTSNVYSQSLNFEVDPYFKSFRYEKGSPFLFFFSARKVNIEYDFGVKDVWKSISVGVGGSGSWKNDNYDGYFVYTGTNYHFIQMKRLDMSIFVNGGIAYNCSDKKFATYNDNGLKVLLWKVFFIKGGISDIIFSKDTYVRIYINPYIGFGGTINF